VIKQTTSTVLQELTVVSTTYSPDALWFTTQIDNISNPKERTILFRSWIYCETDTFANNRRIPEIKEVTY
jgi:diaminopimelate decarboxylase